MLNNLLFRRVDNSALIVFRICFGLLIFLESVGAIFTGWVRRVLIEPEFTFSFIGFEWLQPLPGAGMYFYYGLMGLLGLFVMLGFRYRISMLAFTLMWTATYLMQKSAYNNHYYLLVLICLFMTIVPAHAYFSVDAKRNPKLRSISMPNWVNVVIILQLFIVYTFASVAKLYPDWLDHTVTRNLMVPRGHFPVVGPLLQEPWLHKALTYGGILFDGLIVPALLWKRTQKWAFALSIVFHLFNSFILHIGIFPYLSLAFCLFFFPAKTIHRLFLKRKPLYTENRIEIPSYQKPFLLIASLYFLVQIALPLRHWFIEGNVLYTEEGHRLAWRMMLRGKAGHTVFYVEDTSTGNRTRVKLEEHLSTKQRRSVTTKPDMMWQFAQRLKQRYQKEGKTVKVFVRSRLSVNSKPYFNFIDPTVDLANTPWNHFEHHPWILSPAEE